MPEVSIPLTTLREPTPLVYESETHFRRLLERLPAGAYTCDPEGLITYFNQHAVQLWGRAPKLHDPEDRFCGSFRLFSADGAPISHGACWMALALEKDEEFNGHEIVVERPSGERLTVLAHANPIRDESGKLMGAVNVLVDISERKRTEELLKAADRRKSEFLAMLAHALRNPLAAIRNALDVAGLPESNREDSEWARGVVNRQSAQLARLVDDLLDVSRLTLGKVRLQKEPIDAGPVLDRAVEAVRPLLSERKHELITAYDPGRDLKLDADPVRLEQIVANLLTNAAKYTEPNGRIWLEARRAGAQIVISVRDTGIGIFPEKISEMFELFAQGERSIARSDGGLGLGLTIVRNLVEMHGGDVTANSDGFGKGSEFIVQLPALRDGVTATIGIAKKRNIANSRSLRVLVVDDNHDTAQGMARLLKRRGHTVQTAYEGHAALELGTEFCPEALLLDLGLPGMDGYELARQLRLEPCCDGALFIAVSGYGQEEDLKRSGEAGFDHHLVKPIDPDELQRLLTQPR